MFIISWMLDDTDCNNRNRHVSIILFMQSLLRILTSSWFRITFLVILLAVYGLKRYLRWRKLVNLVEQIPGPPTHWLLGHANLVLDLDRVKFPYGTYVLIYQMLASTPIVYGKEKICRMWLGFRPFVLLFTPEAVEVILTSNTLTNKASEYGFLKPWLGEGLVTSNRSKWKLRRKMLTPAFHFRILNDFLPIINEHAEILIAKLLKLTRNQRCKEVNIVDFITLCTLDVICETAMGIKVRGQEEESEYVNCLHQVSELVLTRLTRPWLWPDFMFFNSNHGKRFKRCLKVMKCFTTKVIKERRDDWLLRRKKIDPIQGKTRESDKQDKVGEEEGFVVNSNSNNNQEIGQLYGNHYNRKRMAFLDILLEHHLDNNSFTIDDVREEVDTFMFAGHDTTAMSISWTLYMLGLHADIQEKVRKEIDDILDVDNNQTSNFTVDQLKQMKYLDCVLKEMQRIYPTAPFIGRELNEDTKINGYLVPKGTTCAIFTYLVHRNSDIFPQPEVFDPDRFTPSQASGRHPFAYIPFSAGPRNCIGQKFAIIEQKIVVANVVRNFYLKSVDERDKLIITGEMVLRSRNGLRLVLEKRLMK